MTRRTLATVVLVLTLAGCGRSEPVRAPGPQGGRESAAGSAADAAAATARRYLNAALADDWSTACALSSVARARTCRTWHLTPTLTPPPSTSGPGPAQSKVPLLVYADGRTVWSTPSPSVARRGPERAMTGPARIDRPAVRVPGTSRHRPGWGVMITHTVRRPGKPTRTVYTALRVVTEGGRWRVEQRADVPEATLTRAADPITSTLAGGLR